MSHSFPWRWLTLWHKTRVSESKHTHSCPHTTWRKLNLLLCPWDKGGISNQRLEGNPWEQADKWGRGMEDETE